MEGGHLLLKVFKLLVINKLSDTTLSVGGIFGELPFVKEDSVQLEIDDVYESWYLFNPLLQKLKYHQDASDDCLLQFLLVTQ